MNNIYKSLFTTNGNGGTISVFTSSSILDLIQTSSLLNNDWRSNSSSAFLIKDQINLDRILFNNLDIISNYKRIEKIKDYEFKSQITSTEFFNKWQNGEIPSTPQSHDWAATLKSINYRNG